MFIVPLRLSSNGAQAAQALESHKAWIKKGFDDGVFPLAGTMTHWLEQAEAVLHQL